MKKSTSLLQDSISPSCPHLFPLNTSKKNTNQQHFRITHPQITVRSCKRLCAISRICFFAEGGEEGEEEEEEERVAVVSVVVAVAAGGGMDASAYERD